MNLQHGDVMPLNPHSCVSHFLLFLFFLWVSFLVITRQIPIKIETYNSYMSEAMVNNLMQLCYFFGWLLFILMSTLLASDCPFDSLMFPAHATGGCLPTTGRSRPACEALSWCRGGSHKQNPS